MILDPYGKSLFKLICKQCAYLHFDVIDTGAKESVPIFISHSMKNDSSINTSKQLAAVQFKGGQAKILNGEIDGVVLRFYKEPCEQLNIFHIIEKAVDYRSPLMSPEKDAYYNYTYTQINPYTINHIQELFEEIENQLRELFKENYDKLGFKSIPLAILQIPRY